MSDKKRPSIKRIIILRVTPLIIFVTLFIVLTENGYYFYNTKNQMEANMKSSSLVLQKNIYDKISEYENILVSLARNRDLIDWEEETSVLKNICEDMGWAELVVLDSDGTDKKNNNMSNQEIFLQPRSSGKITCILRDVTETNGSKQILLGQPLNLEGKFEGVIYCAISADFIQDLLNMIHVGNKGRILILDDQENVIFQKTMTTLENEEENEETLKIFYEEYSKQASQGESGFADYWRDYGKKRLYYAPLEINNWSILIEEDQLECAGIHWKIILIKVCFQLFLVWLCTFLLYKGIKRITTTIKKCAERLKKLTAGDLNSVVEIDENFIETRELTIALEELVRELSIIIIDIKQVLGSLSEGNLDINAKNVYRGEFKQIEDSLNHIIDEFNSMITQLVDASGEVAKGSEQVSQGANGLSVGASEQMMMVQKLYSSINKIAEYLTGIVRIKNGTDDLGGESEKNIKMEELTEAMMRIAESSEQIQKIVKTIAGISSQTKMLSINASVEAARAGAAGKGFSIVAEEIRDLASKSREATNDTKKLVLNVINSVENGSNTVSDTVSSVEEIAILINDFRESLIKISGNIEDTAAISQESAAASEQLNEQANHLQDIVNHFISKR